jgi:hypothetical protein
LETYIGNIEKYSGNIIEREDENSLTALLHSTPCFSLCYVHKRKV